MGPIDWCWQLKNEQFFRVKFANLRARVGTSLTRRPPTAAATASATPSKTSARTKSGESCHFRFEAANYWHVCSYNNDEFQFFGRNPDGSSLIVKGSALKLETALSGTLYYFRLGQKIELVRWEGRAVMSRLCSKANRFQSRFFGCFSTIWNQSWMKLYSLTYYSNFIISIWLQFWRLLCCILREKHKFMSYPLSSFIKIFESWRHVIKLNWCQLEANRAISNFYQLCWSMSFFLVNIVGYFSQCWHWFH